MESREPGRAGVRKGCEWDTDMGASQARPLLLTPGSSLTGVGMSRCETYRHNNQPALLPFVQARLCPPTHKAGFMWTLSSSPKGPWMLAHSFILFIQHPSIEHPSE